MENTKHPKRFNDAVSKLYNAFHENRLVGMDCAACAVGNLCNNEKAWAVVVNDANPLIFGTNGKELIESTGYSVTELRQVEDIFMGHHKWDCGYTNGMGGAGNKYFQFLGLCAVIEFLCELDNIPNIMDIQSLFETENDAPKKQLTEVLC